MAGELRFLWMLVPDEFERAFIGSEPIVIAEGPHNNGFREVRLATDQEIGIWCRLALPPAQTWLAS